jgi:RNA polymerase sigma factor for flagellar operon FliA
MYTAQGKLKSTSGTHEGMPHMPFVRRMNHHLEGRLLPSVDVDGLIRIGMPGLMEAIEHYTVQEGAAFEAYMGQRIRGAMIDHLRSMDIAPRSERRSLCDLEQAIARIRAQVC